MKLNLLFSGIIRGNFFTMAVRSCVMFSMCSVLREINHFSTNMFTNVTSFQHYKKLKWEFPALTLSSSGAPQQHKVFVFLGVSLQTRFNKTSRHCKIKRTINIWHLSIVTSLNWSEKLLAKLELVWAIKELTIYSLQKMQVITFSEISNSKCQHYFKESVKIKKRFFFLNFMAITSVLLLTGCCYDNI